jgi:hypothetical protein
MIARSESEGFIQPEHAQMLVVESEIDVMLDRFIAYEPPTAKWHSGTP